MNTAIKATVIVTLLGVLSNASEADEPAPKKSTRKPLILPGMVVDFENRCVNLEATICLDKGLLELVACRRGSKEHESVVAVSAKAMHIHTALLLLGANNGNPAMRKQVGDEESEEGKRWVNIPPRGDPIGVYLVTTSDDGKAIERPISDFITRSSQRIDEVDGIAIAAPSGSEGHGGKATARLTHTFLFAGSHLRDNGPGPRQYLADISGHVISIATFGDELLCLSFHQSQKNDALMWQVKPNSLPEVGTKITLRLRPQRTPQKPSHVQSVKNAK